MAKDYHEVYLFGQVLGTGDTLKAGCVYGLLHGMDDEDLVYYAAACSGVAISRFPLPLIVDITDRKSV